MRLRFDARGRAILRRLPVNVYSLAELALLGLLAVQGARLFWAIATPIAPLGDWRPAEPSVPGDPAGVLAMFDPFFRISGQQGPAQVSAGDVKLFGVRVDEAMGRGSAIVAGPDGVQKSVSVGEEIAPGVTLKAVAFDHVTLARGGVPEDLYLDQSGGAAGGASAAPPAADRGVSIDQLTQQIGVIPRIQRGAITGLVVRRQGEGTAFAAAGLRDGDVVTALGGKPVSGPDDLDRLRRDYPAGGAIPITVERGGDELELTVKVAAQ